MTGVLLQRQASGEKRFDALDGLRGIAALGVLLLHFGQRSLPWLAPHGPLAVDFFFLLSGFVISHAYETRLRDGLSVSAFISARLIRLYPLIFAGAAIGALGYLHVYRGATLAVVLLTGLLLLPTPLAPISEGRMSVPINPPSWSLMFELLANVAYAALVPVLANRVLGAVVIILGIALGLTAYHYGGLEVGARWPTLLAGIPRVGFSFFAGVGLNRLWKAGALSSLKAPLLVPVGLLIGIISFQQGTTFNGTFELVAVVLAFPMIVVWGANHEPRRSRGICRLAGQLSYPAYILQGGFVPHVAALPQHLHLTGAGALGMIVSVLSIYLVFCWLVLRLFDQPARRFLTARANDTVVLA